MAAPVVDFSMWLSKRLSEISEDIDVDLFVSYITGILDEEETSRDDKLESLSGFLVEVVPESDVGFISESIMNTYETHHKNIENPSMKETKGFDEKLSQLMEQQKLSIRTKHEKSKDESAHKQAILAQYADVSDGEESNAEDECTGATATSSELLVKNTNTSKTDDQQREQREKMKLAHEQKKEKDKLDRERQKQLKQEKADKAKQKTQKQERRR